MFVLEEESRVGGVGDEAGAVDNGSVGVGEVGLREVVGGGGGGGDEVVLEVSAGVGRGVGGGGGRSVGKDVGGVRASVVGKECGGGVGGVSLIEGVGVGGGG